MIQTVSLSNNQALKILRLINEKFPEKKLVTANVRKELVKRNILFENYMPAETKIFVGPNGEDIERSLTYCHDLNGFIEYLCV